MRFRGGGAQGGTGGGTGPPSLYVKKGPATSYLICCKLSMSGLSLIFSSMIRSRLLARKSL
jgi:hypothetical protein